MKQKIHLITLGVQSLDKSKQFYVDGFKWQVKTEDKDTVLYQITDELILSTWLNLSLEKDIGTSLYKGMSHSALAYFVQKREEVNKLTMSLQSAGGLIITPTSRPVHGGLRGYVLDPDLHLWEIIWNENFYKN